MRTSASQTKDDAISLDQVSSYSGCKQTHPPSAVPQAWSLTRRGNGRSEGGTPAWVDELGSHISGTTKESGPLNKRVPFPRQNHHGTNGSGTAKMPRWSRRP